MSRNSINQRRRNSIALTTFIVLMISCWIFRQEIRRGLSRWF